MDASNWINLGLLVVAVIAAIVAILQVVEARRVRNDSIAASADAKRARDSAKAHEKRSLEASESAAASATSSAQAHHRIAEAVEEYANLAREQAARADPWTFRNFGPTNMDQKWEARNNTGAAARMVEISATDGSSWIQPIDDLDEGLIVVAGGAFDFTFLQRLSSPRQVGVRITWYGMDEYIPRQFERTISAAQAVE